MLIEHRTRPISKNGFTMIELIMVIVIISILSVSASSLLSTSAFDARYFYDDLLNGARYAQQMAVTTGCPVGFYIHETDGFWMLRDEINSGACADAWVDSPDVFQPQPLFRPDTAAENYENDEPPDGLTISVIRRDQDNSTTTVADTVVQPVFFYPQGWACDANGSQLGRYEVTLDAAGVLTQVLTIECPTGFVHD